MPRKKAQGSVVIVRFVDEYGIEQSKEFESKAAAEAFQAKVDARRDEISRVRMNP